MAPDKARAERVVLEILCQAGGGLGKTLTYKAFWLAHLYYAENAPGFLTDWPVVRMPRGPGIDRGDTLLRGLHDQGFVELEHKPKGPFTEIHYRLTGQSIGDPLPELAVEAVRQAVADIKGLTTDEVSNFSHDFSRSWNATPNGQELDIYSDLIPDDEYEDRQQALDEMRKTYEGLFE